MPLISLDKISLAFGHVPLLDQVSLQIDKGERVCLVGRNGAGKSSLLKVIDGEIQADEGEFWRSPGLRIASLPQDIPATDARSVYETVASGLEEVGGALSEYHELTAHTQGEFDDALLNRMAQLQQILDSQDGWRLEQRVEMVITRLGLDGDALVSEQSGGYKRRVLLARALVSDPDLLLLDEPTNHLDINGITWLEEFLSDWPGAVLFITHDRAFLRRLATRILDLDRGNLTDWPGNYQLYLQRKQQMLDAEAVQDAKFDKRLAEEERWIRQGIKARRTRNEGRARALKAMRQERSERRELQGKVRLDMEQGELSGKLVAELEDVDFRYADRPLIHGLTTRVMRGDKIGIIGPNAAGKTTLIKLLLGDLAPSAGTVNLGSKLEVAYFDQQKAHLDPELSVLDNLSEGRETITINGHDRHIIGYLGDFLFAPQRVRSPVKSLSGGERSRLLLAKLFAKPANVLVLDEPTNDLDAETIELLESLLVEFQGTVILVSHDRDFLDEVVTSTLAFEGDAQVKEYVGGYKDWLRQSSHAATTQQSKPTSVRSAPSNPEKPAQNQRKLSYKEQRELKELPAQIERLEAEKQKIEQIVSDGSLYQRDKQEITDTLASLDTLNEQLEGCYQRWANLEEINGA